MKYLKLITFSLITIIIFIILSLICPSCIISLSTTANHISIYNDTTFNYESYNIIPEEINKINQEDAGHHFLGDTIAKKIYLMYEIYTYIEPIAPGNPATKTMVYKPIIYNSIRKIEKYFKKEIKKGNITKEEAKIKFNYILDIVILLKNKNTDVLEKYIRNCNTTTDLINLYSHVHLIL